MRIFHVLKISKSYENSSKRLKKNVLIQRTFFDTFLYLRNKVNVRINFKANVISPLLICIQFNYGNNL